MRKPDTIYVSTLTSRQIVVSICIIGLLFFVFGFVTWLNAILIPFFKVACELTNFQSYFVAFAFYISYLVMSVPASYLLKAVGFRKGMMIGFWTMALGAFVFIPAAMTRTYEVFLMGLFAIGIGLAILQTAANPYITILGPHESAAQRISIMGICNKTGGIIAPLLLGAIVFQAADASLFETVVQMSGSEKEAALDALIRRVIVPYSCMGTVLLLLGLVIWISPLPEIDTENESPNLAVANTGKTNIFHFPHLILGAVAIFLHVGTQVTAIDTIIGYAVSLDVPILEARAFPSYTLFATICGYVTGIVLIPRFVSQKNVFRICSMLGLVFSVCVLIVSVDVSFLGHRTNMSIWFIVLLGLANSMIWAGIWPLALHGLGRFTKLGSSVLIMGLSGNALVPLCYGYLADVYDTRTGYVVLIPCFLYLIFYSVYGHKIKSWSLKKMVEQELPSTVDVR